MRRRTLVLLVALGAVLLFAGAAAMLRFHGTSASAPPSPADALVRYRAEAAAGDTAIPPGVYAYLTSGSESTSALGGAVHRYPRRSTITVATAPCGMTFRWDVLETRSTTVTICVTGERSQAVDGWTEHHVFSGHEESATWSCSRPPWLVDPNAVGTRTSHLCAGANSTSAGTVDVLGTGPVRIAGAAVETVHLRLTAEVDGVLGGSVVEDRWVELETGLPVRLRYRARITSSSPTGDSVFRERYELRLSSLERVR